MRLFFSLFLLDLTRYYGQLNHFQNIGLLYIQSNVYPHPLYCPLLCCYDIINCGLLCSNHSKATNHISVVRCLRCAVPIFIDITINARGISGGAVTNLISKCRVFPRYLVSNFEDHMINQNVFHEHVLESGPLFAKQTSCRKILWSLEAAKLDDVMIVQIWNLTGISATLLLRCLSTLWAIGKIWIQISWLRDLTSSYGKAPVRLLNRGSGIMSCELESWHKP